ncbi:MAG: phosphoribosyl-AMP cyclohydrolase [Omnitrophica WOR_2 bacterium RIFCSPHIGHO2_12_FULL_64_13]|nr:MAG: phosphoribosyl-AMP cyclohydrolase [Omnitrophica WOR_2 bacterium RIFCSPHIGHO2_12_FULL_64_13]
MTIPNLKSVLQFDGRGLIPTVIQDAKSKKVLTLCYLNQEALSKSLQTGKVYVFRRSQNRLMLKGETSGHVQPITRVQVDCEGKSLLFLVRQHVAACHEGYFSCYVRRVGPEGRLRVSDKRVFNPSTVYARRKQRA